ncbi:hypothetical protein CEXT_598151 [Caerostris extrusa]|uniref:Uncharacterized protein n=1 Tax=Caerostris extrusa TaxID=172846 RepID=A0AAV4SQK1_CAEEX|nr:hypothetical protein CEXT_598151 [Caerostris extrusa]
MFPFCFLEKHSTTARRTINAECEPLAHWIQLFQASVERVIECDVRSGRSPAEQSTRSVIAGAEKMETVFSLDADAEKKKVPSLV